MSESFSKVEFLAGMPRNNWWDERVNVNPTGLTVEQIELGTLGHAYIPELIKRKRERFYYNTDRFEVMCSDPLAIFIGERWIEEITEKPYKCYEMSEEGEPEEIMADLWERWEQLNIHEIEQAIYPKMAVDGYCLASLYITPMGTPGYNTYGFFESPPDYWKRYNMQGTPYHNIIYDYYYQFIPVPNGYQYMTNYNIHSEEGHLFPQEPGFFHFYRKTWNHGIGRPRIQGIWASMTQLRKMSYADYRRALVFNIFEYPEDWDSEKGLEEMIEAVRRADEVEGVAIPMRVNPTTQEVEEFPRFRERTWDEQGGAPRSDPSAGGSLLRHSEYARVLIALGYTETKLVGSQPGEVTGSKLDLTRDDVVDMREFKLFVPVIKQIAVWLLQNGFLEGLDGETLQRVEAMDYDIKCHVEYEVLENQKAAAEMAEDQAEMDASQQLNSRMNADVVRYNSFVQSGFIEAYRFNFNYPMTPVMSSWIKMIGSDDKYAYMVTHQGYKYRKPKTNPEQTYLDWTDSGSKGGYFWDYLADRSPPWERLGQIPQELEGGYGEQFDPTAEREFKMEGQPSIGLQGVGTSRAAFPATGGTSGTTPIAYNPSVGTIPAMTTTSGFDFDWNYEAYPSSITGSRRHGPGRKRSPGQSGTRRAVVPVNYTNAEEFPLLPNMVMDPTNVSFKKANAMMEKVASEGMSAKTWDKFKKFMGEWQKTNQLRINSVDVGNPMSFDIPLRYAANNDKGFVEEYVCKKEWRLIQNHTGNLYLYPDLKHGGKPVTVGTYKYNWNDENDMPEITREIDDQKLKTTLEKWDKKNSVIYSRLNKGMPQRMSTEYYCKILNHENKRYQVQFHDGHGEPYLKGIAIVEYGNCQEPFCNFTEVDKNA